MSLLDDVSIVVTPNGYKAGELYAVVPVPTEGAELVTNGDFATDSNWNKNSNWTISGGVAIADGSSSNDMNQSFTIVVGTRYKVTYTIVSLNSGSFNFSLGGVVGNTITSIGTYSEEVTAVSTDRLRMRGASPNGSIDNVSVKEYTAADMDVTRATAATRVDEAGLVNYAEIVTGSDIITDGDFPNGSTAWALNGWTISNNAANCSGITANMIQTISGSTNKTYSLTFTISNYVSGNVIPAFVGGNSYSKVYNANGTFTEVISSYSDTRFVFYATSFNGSIDNVSVKEVTRDNVPRIDYTGGGCPHILAEPQRTNLVTYSETFSDSSWTKLGAGTGSTAVVTSDYAISPDGTQNATRLVCDLNGGGGSVSNQSLIYDLYSSSGDQSLSIYVKSNTGSNQTIYFANTQTSGDTIIATNEWKRFTFSHSTTNYVFAVGLRGRTGGAIDDTADILIWGGQAESGSFSTSYIPTSGSTVTRNQDQFTRDGIGSLINSTEGVLFLEMAALADDGTNRYLSISNSTVPADDYIYFRFMSTSNRVLARTRVGGVTINTMEKTISDTTAYNKYAIKWKSGDYAFWINGVEELVDTSATIFGADVLNQIKFDFPVGSGTFPSKVKQLQVYKTALTDEQLIQLTGTSGTDFYESYAEMASALTYTIQ